MPYVAESYIHEMDRKAFAAKIHTCQKDELYLVTPEYLTPYLRYIKEHKRLFLTALNNSGTLRLEGSYAGLFRHIFMSILDRYGIPVQDRHYILAFYMQGLMAILSEWLRNDCADSMEYIIRMIQHCMKKGVEGA